MTYQDYLARVDAVLTIPGTSVTDDFNSARKGYEHLVTLLIDEHTTTQDKLNQAVVTGDNKLIRGALAAHTLAELASRDYDTRNAAERATLATLRLAYRATATANYHAVAAWYNDQAKALAEDVAAVDIAARAEDVISGTAKARTAWEYAPLHAQALEQAATVLHEAAYLAEVQLHHTTHERHTDQRLALTLDPSTLGIRELWSLWDQEEEHRAGRYGALAAAHVKLRAADIDDFAPHRRPKPFETTYVPSGRGHRAVQLDPEDPASLAQIA